MAFILESCPLYLFIFQKLTSVLYFAHLTFTIQNVPFNAVFHIPVKNIKFEFSF